MRLETLEKHDFEELRCKAWSGGQHALLEEIRQDRFIVEGMLGDASTERVRSEGATKQSADTAAKLDQDLELHTKQCATTIKDLNGQLVMAKSDLEVMFKILDISQCKATLLQIQASVHANLLQCRDSETGRTYTKLAVDSDRVRRELDRIRHPQSMVLLNDAIGQPINASDAPDSHMQNEKCVLDGTASCPVLREKFLDMQAGLENSVIGMRRMLQDSETGCEITTSNLKAQKAHHVAIGSREGTMFLQASQDVSEYGNQKNEKDRLEQDAMAELNHETEKCRVLLDELKDEHCALDKIRGELLHMYSLPNDVQDCAVSEWEESECSASCGGGARILTRRITVPPGGGSRCPALSAKQPCNQQRCPKDCQLGDWTQWNPCSAFCDGGVRGKLRPIKFPGTKGGTPCGESSVTEACNMQACDADCELHGWTEWTPTCTKWCGGGKQSRFRNILAPAMGKGTCSDSDSAKRLREKPCNTQPCTYNTSRVLTCDAKFDIVLLLDGSGSLGQANYDLVKSAASELTAAMGPGVKVGALVFSGPSYSREEHPKTWLNWDMCMGNKPWDASALSKNPSEICGMKWASHLSFDTAAVKASIQSAAYPGLHTFTHLGLLLAGEELKSGRQDAQSIIITITDGEPSFAAAATAAAGKLKQWVRLMWVPVGLQGGTQKFQSLASEPSADNVVSVENIKEIASTGTINKIIEGFCLKPS